MRAHAIPKASPWTVGLALALVAALLVLAAPARAQAPGEYPHLRLTDRVNGDVPGPAGPWNNSHVFHAFSGMSFDAKISYQSAGQLNTHVFWAILVSANATPFPKNIVPPKLLTMPPFILIMPPVPALNAQGEGQMTLFVPAGLFAVDAYVQGLVYDSVHAPPMQLSNGLKVDIEVPGLSVNFAFLRNQETGPEGQLSDAGVIDIDSSRLKTLKPLGPNPAPAPFDTDTPPPGTSVQVENPVGNAFTFQPILSNQPDAPVNPLARPLTTIVGAVTATATTITVADTSFFPKRGKLLISAGNSNIWANRVAPSDVPNVEVVAYDGKTRTSFLNCQRLQVGTQLDTISTAHVNGEFVAGEYTLATTAGARERTRVGLDADNPDLPHVVLPDISFVPAEGGAATTRSLDLYRSERSTNSEQAFLLFERRTGTWRTIPGSVKTPFEGTWDPMICVAPDNRSFIATLRANPTLGQCGWDNVPDQIFAIRLDGLNWPATGTQVWAIDYQLQLGIPNCNSFAQISARRPVPRCFAFAGADPDNYVLYAGLASKWKITQPFPGSSAILTDGFEADYIREEVLVDNLFELPLVGPGSSKTPPAMPRPLIASQFGNTGTGFPVVRFDPEMLASRDGSRLLIVAGSTAGNEDAYIVRNISVTAGGSVSKVLVNVSGALEEREIRAISKGGHGQGDKAAFTPNGTRVAYVVRGATVANQRKDWIDIALTSGASFGQVKHVYADAGGSEFKIAGAYTTERVITGLRFLDNTRLVFLMGRNPYDDPLGFDVANQPAMEWFVYDLSTGVMTNLTKSYDTPPVNGTSFTNLGKLNPGGLFTSPGGGYTYLLRCGGVGTTGGSSLAAGTAVGNLLGLNHETLGVFPVTGDEFGQGPVANLTLPVAECRAPVETAAAMQFTEAAGVQHGMLYFTSHLTGGNGSDEVFALNRDAPFVALQATTASGSGLHVRNVAPDPYSGKVAFSRSASSTPGIANEHPFVVDLDSFLFERDILPTWTSGGSLIGRVMDGSFQFVAPNGSADEALVFAFGLAVTPNGGVAQVAPPAYYPLATVSDPLAEPIPVVIPLIDTALLGGDFRFYVLAAGPSTGN